MGILRDTYIINNKTDTGPVSYEMSRKNDIEEKRLKIENDTKDRVNISLREYEKLKTELQDANCIINDYQAFYHNLGKTIHCDPKVILTSKIRDVNINKNPLTMKYDLCILLELEEVDR